MTSPVKEVQTAISIPVDQFKTGSHLGHDEARILARLDGILTVPANAQGIVLFAHGSGSSRLSKRNQYVANILNDASIATLLFDLLTAEEEGIDEYNRQFRFDIELLALRLLDATKWIQNESKTRDLNIGYFGASTGGAAALVAAAKYPQGIKAVVSRGGRPDLAGPFLEEVKAPTLLIVGGLDDVVIELNQQAMAKMNCPKKFEIVPHATHLFEEPGTLEKVAYLAKQWFDTYLG